MSSFSSFVSVVLISKYKVSFGRSSRTIPSLIYSLVLNVYVVSCSSTIQGISISVWPLDRTSLISFGVVGKVIEPYRFMCMP